MPSPDAPRDADRERLARLLYEATVSVQPNPPSWEYRALYSPNGHAPYYAMADAVLADRAEESHPLYSVTQEGLITIVQCGSCADLRAQLATVTAKLAEWDQGAWEGMCDDLHAAQDALATVTAERDRATESEARAMSELARVIPLGLRDLQRAEQAEREAHALATEWQARRDEMIAAHERALRAAEGRVGALAEALIWLTDNPREVYIGSRKIQLEATMDPDRYTAIRALLAPPAGSAGATG